MTNYPLAWPAGWRRTKSRKDANFKRGGQRLSIADGVKRVIEQLRLFGIPDWNIVVSTNVKPRLDGLPLSNQVEPQDPGVAVYWKKEKDTQHKVMATDRYVKMADNLAAIAATLDAMRAIERHGGAVIMERAFTGFLSLPAPNTWRAVLSFQESEEPDLETVRNMYRNLAREVHPDLGGTDARMAELNWAMAEAEKELR
jgi:hypothetical protein